MDEKVKKGYESVVDSQQLNNHSYEGVLKNREHNFQL
jgi:hypothetical protein